MGRIIASRIKGMSRWAKGALVVAITLLLSVFMQQGWFTPTVSDSATNTYHFSVDTTAVNLGADGNTLIAALTTLTGANGKYSLAVGTYSTGTGYLASGTTANSTTNMASLYSPLYKTTTVLSAPVMNLAIRSGATGTTNWGVIVYDYDPAGAVGNGTVLWTGTATSTSTTTASRPVGFTQVAASPVTIARGHRLKFLVTATPTTANAARLYFYSSASVNSYCTFSESYPTSTTDIANITDYNSGYITQVTQGQQNVPMLSFQVSTNAGVPTTWTDGKLDLTGTPSPGLGDVTFMIYKDSDRNGVFNPALDQKVSDEIAFTQASGQPYTLVTPQSVTSTVERYFVVFNVSPVATATENIGAQILNESYFTVSTNNVNPMLSGASSQIAILAANTSKTKTYAVDFDSGTPLTTPLAGSTSTACSTTASSYSTAVTGLLNPTHTCTAPLSTSYNTLTTSGSINLYFNGDGYQSLMTTVAPTSFNFFAGGTGAVVYAKLFYIAADGTKVNLSGGTDGNSGSAFASNTVSARTISFASGFSNVPKGARLGMTITSPTASARIALNSAAGAKLVVTENASSIAGIDVGDGKVVADSTVAATATGSVVDAFTLLSPTPGTVTSLTVTGNATTNATNVARVTIYKKVGSNLAALEGSDLPIGSASFSGSGNSTIVPVSDTVNATKRNYLVVYDMTAGAVVGQKLTGTISAAAGVKDSGGALPSDIISDSSSATLTLIASTTVTNGNAEAAPRSIPASAGATAVDNFGLYVNSATPDAIKTVTVQLASGSSGAIAAVDIVDVTNNKTYTSTAPISGDTWRITTSGLSATSATTQCTVRITPKADAAGTFYVTAQVTGITNTQTTNSFFFNDLSWSTVVIDAFAPPNASLSAGSGALRNTVNLSWSAVTDSNTLDPAVGYKVVRGAANSPAPADCSGPAINANPALLSLTDTGVGGTSYGYRVCSQDKVGNLSTGAIATATAKLPQTCNQAPGLTFISSANQYATTDGQVEYQVNVLNNDIGACADVNYAITLEGAPNEVAFELPVLPASIAVPAGGGANFTVKIKARADAAQGQSETFNIKLSAGDQATQVAGPGYAATSAPMVTAVNNFGPMLHSSFSVGSKYGTWGTTSTCNDCHIGTSESTDNIKLIRRMVTTPNGQLRPVVFNQISSSTAQSGTLGNDRRANPDGSTNICEVCHHQTKFHEYSAVSARTVLGHKNGQDCMSCHPHKGGFKPTGAADCVTCHGNPPTSKLDMASPATNALGTNPSDRGAHLAHNALQMSCQACHNAYDATKMGNTALEMGFAIRSTTYKGFQGVVNGGAMTVSSNINTYYHWASNSPGTVITEVGDNVVPSCTVYCHGGWAGGGGTNTSPSWVGLNQAACGTCHSVSNANPPVTGSHQKHVSSGNFVNGKGATVGGLNMSCDKCHGAFRNFTGHAMANHVNGKVEWDLSAISSSASYNGVNKGDTGTVALGRGFAGCSNLYCHSSVQGATGLGAGSYAATNPVWGGSADCGSCHADMANSPSGATGGHKQHAQPSGGFATPFDCRVCHGSGGSTNPLNHANGSINMDFSGYGANTNYSKGGSFTPGAGYGTCSNANCHGRRDSLAWGPSTALSLCDKCHGSQTSPRGFYATSGPDQVAGNTDPIVGAHNAHIHQVNSAFTLYTSYSMAKDCSECHIKPTGPYDAGHIDTALPAEVTFQPGKIANRAIDTGVPGALAPSYDQATRTCNNVWCHGSAMDSNTGQGAYANVPAAALGKPRVPTWNTPFLTGVAGNDCSACHSYPPPAPDESYTHFSHYSTMSDGSLVALAKVPNECNSCHVNVNTAGTGFLNSATHINGTVDKGCQACHGVPPTSAGSLAITSNGALAAGQAGAHLAHASIPAIGKTCTTCHSGYGVTSMPNGAMEMGFNAMNGQVTSGTFWGYSSVNNGLTVYTSTSPGTSVFQTNTVSDQNSCSVYCHGSTLGGGTLAKPTWDSGARQVCGNCHGVNVAYLNTTSLPAKGIPLTSSHPKHTGIAALNIGCDACHGVINNNAHVDGNVTWNLDLNNPLVGSGASYKGSAKGGTAKIALGASYGNCSNVYCHSSGQSSDGGSSVPNYANQQWGTGALACNSCHADMNASGTGSHTFHTRSATGNYTCISCHGAGYTTSPGSITATTHVDKVINVAAGAGYSKGTSFGPGTGYQTCTNTCHGLGTPTWGTPLYSSAQCQKCHGDQNSAVFYSTAFPTKVVAQSDRKVGAHNGHVQGSFNYAAPLACSACHPNVVNVNDAGHLSGAVDFNTTNITSYDPSTGTCTSTCHKGKSVVWNDTSYLVGTPSAAECSKCHDVPPASAAHLNAGVAANFAANGFSACVTCHPHLNADGSFNNKALHLNGAVDAMSAGGSDCSACHTTLAMSSSNTSAYHHVLASTSPDYTGNTCLKCHADHNIFQVAQNSANTTGVSANLRVDNSLVPRVGDAPGTSYTNTDFVAGASNGGICISCHSVKITKNVAGQKNVVGFINITTLSISKASFTGSAHNYTAAATYSKDSSQFQANCSKCHNDTLAETKQLGAKTFGLHLSQTRELFNAMGAANPVDAREDRLCYGCHSTQGQTVDGQTGKPTAGKDWYGNQAMSAAAEDTFTSFSTNTRVFRHNVGKYNGIHKANENESFIIGSKHVECADCHTSHAAKSGNHTKGSAALASVLTGVSGVTPNYGSGSTGLPGVTGTTLYLDATTPPAAPNSTHASGVTFTTSTWQSVGMSGTAPAGGTATTKIIATTATSGNYNGQVGFVSPVMSNGSTLYGQTVTLTFYANCASATSAPRIYGTMYLWNGTTATQLVASTQIATLTAASAAYTLTANIPQTAVTNANTVLVAELYPQSRGSVQNVTFSYNATGAQSKFVFSAGAVWNSASGYSAGTATQEYQICFKCHSNANSNVASWGGSAAASWTDLALEFNPSNASRHPIGSALAPANQLTTAKLNGGWTPGMVMNCTDCHATDSTASKGPHGSSVKWMLAGTNKSWPYTSAAQNGTSSGTLFRVATYNSGVGTVNGLFCLNCHQVTASNPFHSSGDITGGKHGANATVAACVSCHIRVPHGGKVSRLRLTTNAPTRYRADGNATSPAFGAWAPIGSSVGSGTIKTNTCGQHSGGSATESW
jgi:predicted CxxxxCH...CXXCH cytochrome family protein